MLTDLADVIRRAGLDVVEEPGWRTRGHGGSVCSCPDRCPSPRPFADVRAIVAHHTAGPVRGDAPSLRIVRDGRRDPNPRRDLPGPLAQLVLARSGRVHVVAAGLCWHTGATHESWQSGPHAIGIEAEHTGDPDDPWPADQYRAYVRLARALADHYRVPYSRVLGHREIAWPTGRKVDPTFDLDRFRADLEKEQLVPDTWATPVRNLNGHLVQPAQVLVATEQRVAALQADVAALRQLVGDVLKQVAALQDS